MSETIKPTDDLAREEIIRAATNAPTEVFINLGGREFPIRDLDYDSYITFILKLQPLLESIVGKIASFKGISVPGAEVTALNPKALLEYCGTALPELVTLICQQSEPNITEDQVKAMCPSPFKMASAVIAQIHQNRMISDFADFFGQILPLMSLGSEAETPKKSKTKATR